MPRFRARGTWAVVVLLVLTCCGWQDEEVRRPEAGPTGTSGPVGGGQAPPRTEDGPRGTVTLAFAGDAHFQLHLTALLDRVTRAALGPVAGPLSDADLTMLNLESAITQGGRPEAKELEEPGERYWFRAPPSALRVLAAAGVDVVSMANNHAADYGTIGLQDTFAAIREGPVPVIGVGRNRRAAFTPHRVPVRGTDFAFLAGDASPREGSSGVWAAGRTSPGVAAARGPRPSALLKAVRAANRRDDVVVVYLHWGAERQVCPTDQQRTLAGAVAAAGADIVVGSHAHVPLGSGWIGDTYVSYGLGNFLWYHDQQPDSGLLRLRVEDGEVVGDSWVPARIQADGRPSPLVGRARSDAIAEWRRLRGCTDLAARRDGAALPAYTWSSRPIGPGLRQRMRSSHRPGCPVPLSDLRHLRMSYVGFDGTPRTGEMVVHENHAKDVAGAFRSLYDARWPIQRMRLVDPYGGSDARSMAANNTSGYNCRRVAGSPAWSDHAYGAAVDINPLQNPDLSGGTVAPSPARTFAFVDRSGEARPRPGVITASGPVVRAFQRMGWEWGGTWSFGEDYQHFSTRRR